MIRECLTLAFVICVFGCRKPYNPPEIASPGSYLVVAGVINAGADSTSITLSRTVSLSSLITANPVSGATVSVLRDDNTAYPLIETTPGNYTTAGLNLDNTRNYRLSVKTGDGQAYLSDFEPVINTPPIDSIGYTVQGSGINLYVNTHDPSNNLKYYRWDYQETWQFHALYQSEYITNGKAIVYRTAAQNIYTCFAGDASSNILLGSTAKLSQALIYQSPLTQVASTSEKLETRYSILVHQYALSADAYNFWLNLKKNTEQLGSIFDPQPSNINGNMHNATNPSGPVIGYISVCNVQQKRIFISAAQLPGWFPTYPYSCQEDTAYYCRSINGICQNDVALFLIPLGSPEIPVIALNSSPQGLPPDVIGFLGADRTCVDCTIRGTTVQPSFWK
jgi:hypothetical protein